MQISSRQGVWSQGASTEAEILLKPSTGHVVTFAILFRAEPAVVDWGDGTVSELEPPEGGGNVLVTHDYVFYGSYRMRLRNVLGFGFRTMDGQAQSAADGALVSVVDRSGLLQQLPSGAFKNAYSLKRFIAPGATWVGQRTFFGCTSLAEVELGKVSIHYDGSFQGCTSLVDFRAASTGQCWSYVWKGCAALRTLRLGSVSQFATGDFDGCAALEDVWIDGRSILQIRQDAPSGNIASGYGAAFPWGAPRTCRFHGTDGYVLGSGELHYN